MNGVHEEGRKKVKCLAFFILFYGEGRRREMGFMSRYVWVFKP